jgi:hypothetical protein
MCSAASFHESGQNLLMPTEEESERMLEIAGLPVPDLYLRAVRISSFAGDEPFETRGGADAYGHPLTLSIVQMYQEPADLIRATTRVAIGFEPDAWYGARTPAITGAISDIVDFSRILCFGVSAEGEPFCFDFRDELESPSVICWDGNAMVWRRIAPDVEGFLRIFEID